MNGINLGVKKNINGFTLTEVIVVTAIIAIVASIAAPSIIYWQRNLKAKQAARSIVSTIREARERAISTNTQYSVQVTPSSNEYVMKRGNRRYNTPFSNFSTVTGYDFVIDQSTLIRGGDCISMNNLYVQANPNGSLTLNTPDMTTTVSNAMLCVSSSSGSERYAITVLKSGLVRMQKQ
ncbi:pilus assembly FimT family protein [Geobacter pickeringii]|uniref:pilus assembly FimT family protein n=1 Tax=Geobacter pickeringii TaxID=345632 RepID=UPI000A05A55C|nr:prepilin-type N-terminal cleavage/methylation domain-containing protein [Geobacter pickeringii]